MGDRFDELAKAIVGWHDGNDCDKCTWWVASQLRDVHAQGYEGAKEEAKNLAVRHHKAVDYNETIAAIICDIAALTPTKEQP